MHASLRRESVLCLRYTGVSDRPEEVSSPDPAAYCAAPGLT